MVCDGVRSAVRGAQRSVGAVRGRERLVSASVPAACLVVNGGALGCQSAFAVALSRYLGSHLGGLLRASCAADGRWVWGGGCVCVHEAFEQSLASRCQCLAGPDREKLGPRSDNARLGPGASRLAVTVVVDGRWCRVWIIDVLETFCGSAVGPGGGCAGASCSRSSPINGAWAALALFSAAPHLRDTSVPTPSPHTTARARDHSLHSPVCREQNKRTSKCSFSLRQRESCGGDAVGDAGDVDRCSAPPPFECLLMPVVASFRPCPLQLVLGRQTAPSMRERARPVASRRGVRVGRTWDMRAACGARSGYRQRGRWQSGACGGVAACSLHRRFLGADLGAGWLCGCRANFTCTLPLDLLIFRFSGGRRRRRRNSDALPPTQVAITVSWSTLKLQKQHGRGKSPR